MKHIVKKQEPQEFLNWKQNDKMYKRGKPNWNRVDVQIKEIIKTSLKKEQGYICCPIVKEDYLITTFISSI